MRRWSIEPVLWEVRRQLGPDYSQANAAALLDVDKGSWARWVKRGYFVADEKKADDMAGKLGCHPVELWPDWYLVAV